MKSAKIAKIVNFVEIAKIAKIVTVVKNVTVVYNLINLDINKYYIKNEKVSKEEFEITKKKLNLRSKRSKRSK